MHSNKTENKREDILKANEIAALAVDQFNNGDLDNAIDNFEKALELYPDSLLAPLYYSLCKIELMRQSGSLQQSINHPENRKHFQDITMRLDHISTLIKRELQ